MTRLRLHHPIKSEYAFTRRGADKLRRRWADANQYHYAVTRRRGLLDYEILCYCEEEDR